MDEDEGGRLGKSIESKFLSQYSSPEYSLNTVVSAVALGFVPYRLEFRFLSSEFLLTRQEFGKITTNVNSQICLPS